MIINGIEVTQHELSYDKIIKSILEQSDQMTIRFINGLFNDQIPLDTPVEWLDKESVGDEYKAFVADFYPKIGNRIYSIEIEQDDNGDMAFRVFRYALGGALHHSMFATDSNLKIAFPQPCVVFLKSTANTPKTLTWDIDFFDGQTVSLQIPVVRLADMSVDEIAQRGLFPIGQFYLRTFEPLTNRKLDEFRTAAEALLANLKDAVENKAVPFHLGLKMQDNILKTFQNTIIKAQKEVDLTMTTNILETLPCIDYLDLFQKLEARGRAESQKNTALRAFSRLGGSQSPESIIQMLRELDIPEQIIQAAQAESVH